MGQRPSLRTGCVASARSHCPRAAHCGLMHCTVKPGKYCMQSPRKAPLDPCAPRARNSEPLLQTDAAGIVVLLHCGVKRKYSNI